MGGIMGSNKQLTQCVMNTNVEELKERAMLSVSQYKNGQTISHKELEKEIKTWYSAGRISQEKQLEQTVTQLTKYPNF
ncbi:hypothetical protein Barb7_01828 [Bacteroidales bacterium Barb7]|nr:hypothetical protein Barb7_01828 [Bacteroidales bacterium Barb7]